MGQVDDAFPDYDEISAEWEDPEVVDPTYPTHVQAVVKQRRLVCVDGPFDGMELDVPPGGSQVVINAAFGRKTDLRGPVVYTVTDTPEGLRLVFAGQPDQTDAIAQEMAGRTDETPRLIVLP